MSLINNRYIALCSSRILFPTYLRKVPKNVLSSFTGRDFLFDNHEGFSGTLSNRFIKYLALQNCKFERIIPQSIKYSEFYPPGNIDVFTKALRITKSDQLARLIIFTYTYKCNSDPNKLAQVINEIDRECEKRINEFSNEDIFDIFLAFMYLMPSRITQLGFYKSGIKRLVYNFKTESPKEKFVELCFYTGLQKKNRESSDLMKMIFRNYLPFYLNKLCSIEFAIVSNSAYKTSFPITENAFNDTLVDKIMNADPKDDAILITFLKSLRLNRVKSKCVYEYLTTLLLDNKLQNFQFKGLVHIFAYFADGLYNHNVCDVIVKQCLSKLRTYELGIDSYVNDVRGKDIAKFLWCCSYLKCPHFTQEDFRMIETIIQEKIDNEEFKYSSDDLIDAVLSLWMLNYKTKYLIDSVYSLHKEIKPRAESKQRVKLDSRYELLLNCVKIEMPDWLPNSKKVEVRLNTDNAPKYLVQNCKALQEVYGIIEQNLLGLNVKFIKYVSPIEHINIANIFVELNDGKTYYLLVLEENHLLKYGKDAVAIIELELRLLKNLGMDVIMVYPTTNKEELLSQLQDKLILKPTRVIQTVI